MTGAVYAAPVSCCFCIFVYKKSVLGIDRSKIQCYTLFII